MSWDTTKNEITDIAVQTFGISVTYKPVAGGTIAIKGIFTRDWVEIKAGPGVGMSGFHAMIDISLADLLPTVPRRGDKVTIDSIDYNVMDSREDGGGGTRLILQK